MISSISWLWRSIVPSGPSEDASITRLLAESLFKEQHLLSVEQLDPLQIDQILAVAREMRLATEQRRVLNLIPGVVLGEIFYEASSRTSTSFDSAMKRIEAKQSFSTNRTPVPRKVNRWKTPFALWPNTRTPSC